MCLEARTKVCRSDWSLCQSMPSAQRFIQIKSVSSMCTVGVRGECRAQACVCACACEHMCLSMYACVHVCMYTCVCFVNVCVCLCVRACLCLSMRVCVRASARVSECMSMRVCVCVSLRVCGGSPVTACVWGCFRGGDSLRQSPESPICHMTACWPPPRGVCV